ncbi:MAG: hypothetical protein KZQ64_07400 [gamma proteobacterium symbiont of Bathyaustriella thionipta]|nr:hypothetical protein [gamma proteobacterium symbiont of Bathyaustriella thionipta]MCU7950967.1 hypothetical protein [gamma proteobacterium symbiont of Bathyaustriella thionipta]MCU7953196.1 hypothetical protein [gamma proteobacterium symbiont of Bathyaustriella thionipta]MCU7957453.1 hypothetical protein [gamma proteobacterium symbiont of Bathyaustriella thionipta]MCU7968399.1 hypothetical protein [gamma proteobacterium symbiont of Bathyaustriella thionipta]
MLAILEKVAIIYSLATLFVIELIYQTIKVLITGTRYSFFALKKTLIDSFFELLSDIIMFIIDFMQALIEGFSLGWRKALTISSEFNHDTRQ